MTEAELNQAINLINTASLDDYRVLVSTLKNRYNAINHKHTSILRCGQRVSFETKRGIKVEGIVTKVNRKTVKVMTDDTQFWAVSPLLISIKN